MGYVLLLYAEMNENAFFFISENCTEIWDNIYISLAKDIISWWHKSRQGAAVAKDGMRVIIALLGNLNWVMEIVI